MGNKYDKAAERIVQEQSFEIEQEQLRKKYDVPQNVIVKEKNNMAKFTIKMLRDIIKLFATICILILAATGLIALLYEQPRCELMNVFAEILNGLRNNF